MCLWTSLKTVYPILMNMKFCQHWAVFNKIGSVLFEETCALFFPQSCDTLRVFIVGVSIAQPLPKKGTLMVFQLLPSHLNLKSKSGNRERFPMRQFGLVSFLSLTMNAADHSHARYSITGLQEMEVIWTEGHKVHF